MRFLLLIFVLFGLSLSCDEAELRNKPSEDLEGDPDFYYDEASVDIKANEAKSIFIDNTAVVVVEGSIPLDSSVKVKTDNEFPVSVESAELKTSLGDVVSVQIYSQETDQILGAADLKKDIIVKQKLRNVVNDENLVGVVITDPGTSREKVSYAELDYNAGASLAASFDIQIEMRVTNVVFWVAEIEPGTIKIDITPQENISSSTISTAVASSGDILHLCLVQNVIGGSHQLWYAKLDQDGWQKKSQASGVQGDKCGIFFSSNEVMIGSDKTGIQNQAIYFYNPKDESVFQSGGLASYFSDNILYQWYADPVSAGEEAQIRTVESYKKYRISPGENSWVKEEASTWGETAIFDWKTHPVLGEIYTYRKPHPVLGEIYTYRKLLGSGGSLARYGGHLKVGDKGEVAMACSQSSFGNMVFGSEGTIYSAYLCESTRPGQSCTIKLMQLSLGGDESLTEETINHASFDSLSGECAIDPPRISIDSKNNIYLMYPKGDETGFTIKKITSSNVEDISIVAAMSKSASYNYDVVVDQSDHVHLLWTHRKSAQTSTTGLFHSRLGSSEWSQPEWLVETNFFAHTINP